MTTRPVNPDELFQALDWQRLLRQQPQLDRQMREIIQQIQSRQISESDLPAKIKAIAEPCQSVFSKVIPRLISSWKIVETSGEKFFHHLQFDETEQGFYCSSFSRDPDSILFHRRDYPLLENHDCGQVTIMLATAGNKAEEYWKATQQESLLDGLISEAVGAAIVEGMADQL